MKFFNRKKKKAKYKYVTEFKIHFSDGNWFSARRATVQDGPIIEPWKAFYKWYFGREQSAKFMFKYHNGETLILRTRIVQFHAINLKVLE